MPTSFILLCSLSFSTLPLFKTCPTITCPPCLLPNTSSSATPTKGGHHPAQLSMERRDIGHKRGERLLNGQQRQGVSEVAGLWPRLHSLSTCTTSPPSEEKAQTEGPI